MQQSHDVVKGHANLYQLFLWWAIRATRPGGTIAFLVPQSFRSGLYFEKLRAQIDEACLVRAVTHFGHRTNVFEDVDQALACIALQRRSEMKDTKKTVRVEIFQNGSITQQPVLTNSFAIETDALTRRWGRTLFWVLSENKQDYDILDRVLQYAGKPFQDSDKIHVQNGGFVWNQQKQFLLAHPTRTAKPLISAASISPFCIKFPVSCDAPNYKRQYVISNKGLTAPTYRQEVVLVQRTTARKSGRRIVGALLSDDVISFGRGFYIENHVNVIREISDEPITQRHDLLWGVTGWVNSRLLNFVFDMLNGSAHISTYELNMLPFPEELVADIAPLARKVAGSRSILVSPSYERLEEIVADYFELTKTQQQRLKAKIR